MKNRKFRFFHVLGGGKSSIIIVVLMIIILLPVFLYLACLLTQFLWNMSIASIFDLKDITLAQAAALLVLSKILFGNFQRDSKECDCDKKSEDKPEQENKSLPPIKEIE